MYLLDSDAARKLCQYLLLDEFAASLGCGFQEFAVLPQLKFQLATQNESKALKKLGSSEAVLLAQTLVAAAVEIDLSPDAANTLLQISRPDIDSGEAVLFAALSQRDQDMMVSGDKRAYAALSGSLVEGLWLRLICLEEAVLIILKYYPFELVSGRVRARSDVDISLRIAFGSSSANTQETVIAALESYLGELVRSTGNNYRPLAEKLVLVRRISSSPC
ncbi:hypothetical protein RSA46_05585 [Pseudomonas oryzihabitans]|nr:hypothetical protein SB5_10310 [Pseudomonas psychrotolerans]KTT45829.1 hypothetical protein RSA46_05585 [Pseudomonas psychrotolerans]